MSKDTPDIGTVASAAMQRQFKNLLAKIKKGSITAQEMTIFTQLEKRLKAEQGGDGVTYKRDDVAKHFNKTPTTIYNWLRSGMPVNPDGGFCIPDIQAWLDSRKNKAGKPEADTAEYWQTQFKKNRAKLSGLELKLKKGELLAKADVLTAFREMQSYVKNHLALIPRTVPGKLTGQPPQKMQSILTELTSDILTNMSKGQNASTLEARLK